MRRSVPAIAGIVLVLVLLAEAGPGSPSLAAAAAVPAQPPTSWRLLLQRQSAGCTESLRLTSEGRLQLLWISDTSVVEWREARVRSAALTEAEQRLQAVRLGRLNSLYLPSCASPEQSPQSDALLFEGEYDGKRYWSYAAQTCLAPRSVQELLSVLTAQAESYPQPAAQALFLAEDLDVEPLSERVDRLTHNVAAARTTEAKLLASSGGQFAPLTRRELAESPGALAAVKAPGWAFPARASGLRRSDPEN